MEDVVIKRKQKQLLKGVLTLVLLGAAALGLIDLPDDQVRSEAKTGAARTSLEQDDGDALLQRAFDERANDLQVRGVGKVVKVLADDNKGSRHQRFILALASGQRLLVAHNIDLAPRINRLKKGDAVVFYGEYEWNERGGVIHWTHHDPGGRHIDGYLEHKGKRYE